MLEILTIIGSLASIASLAVQAGTSLRSDGSVDVDNALGRVELNEQQQQALQVEGAREIIGILIIDQGLLDDIRKIIDGCIARYRGMLKKASNRAQADQADKSAERCVCDALNRIKRRNNGQLPPGSFQNWWKSYRCIDDFDY